MTRQEVMRPTLWPCVEVMAFGVTIEVGWPGPLGRRRAGESRVDGQELVPRPMLTNLYILDVTAWGWTLT